jgi:hypothetical protein
MPRLSLSMWPLDNIGPCQAENYCYTSLSFRTFLFCQVYFLNLFDLPYPQAAHRCLRI